MVSFICAWKKTLLPDSGKGNVLSFLNFGWLRTVWDSSLAGWDSPHFAKTSWRYSAILLSFHAIATSLKTLRVSLTDCKDFGPNDYRLSGSVALPKIINKYTVCLWINCNSFFVKHCSILKLKISLRLLFVQLNHRLCINEVVWREYQTVI